MKHVILTLGIFSLGFLVSCNSSTESEASNQDNIEQHDHDHDHDHDAEEDDHYHDDGQGLQLNNGEKWKVNEEMKPFVMQGQELVVSYADLGDDDYKGLAEKLADQNKQLITSCTMDGVSHDELHKWLHPHLELTAELKAAKDTQEAKTIVNKLIDSYGEYHKFFN